MANNLCPYCGGILTAQKICSDCGSSVNVNQQYFDPVEQSWQFGRFLRNFKYRKIITITAILLIMYGLIRQIIDILRF